MSEVHLPVSIQYLSGSTSKNRSSSARTASTVVHWKALISGCGTVRFITEGQCTRISFTLQPLMHTYWQWLPKTRLLTHCCTRESDPVPGGKAAALGHPSDHTPRTPGPRGCLCVPGDPSASALHHLTLSPLFDSWWNGGQQQLEGLLIRKSILEIQKHAAGFTHMNQLKNKKTSSHANVTSTTGGFFSKCFETTTMLQFLLITSSGSWILQADKQAKRLDHLILASEQTRAFRGCLTQIRQDNGWISNAELCRLASESRGAGARLKI